jgi:hypothetical protein
MPLTEAALTDMEARELGLLKKRYPKLHIPQVGALVTRYKRCKFYNVNYVGVAEGAGSEVRDCHAAADFPLDEGDEFLRAYGEIRHFFYLALTESNAMVCIAYVEWFVKSQDRVYLFRQKLAADKTYHRAVPISEFVCKFALLPIEARKTKFAYLELP